MIEVGDIIFAHTNGIIGKAIRFAEWWHHPTRMGSQWNHVAIVTRIDDHRIFITQAQPHGVTNDMALDELIDVNDKMLVYRPPAHLNHDAMLEFAFGEVGSHYGFLSIASVATDIITPTWAPAIRTPDSWICSALAAEYLRVGGWVHRWPDIYGVMPAQLELALHADLDFEIVAQL